MNPASIKYLFLGLVVVAAVIEVGADFLLKQWAIKDRPIFIVLGVISVMLIEI